MKNLAPEIVRQRLLIEGFYTVNANEQIIKEFLLSLIKELNLRAYGEPVIFEPASGMGKEQNSGFDAFIPLIDSGISAYFWNKSKFLSIIIYTCKNFDDEKAITFTKNFWQITNEIESMGF